MFTKINLVSLFDDFVFSVKTMVFFVVNYSYQIKKSICFFKSLLSRSQIFNQFNLGCEIQFKRLG